MKNKEILLTWPSINVFEWRNKAITEKPRTEYFNIFCGYDIVKLDMDDPSYKIPRTYRRDFRNFLKFRQWDIDENKKVREE